VLFIDLVDPKASEYMGIGKFDFYLFTPLVMILVGYSIYLLRIKTSKQVYLFILILISSTALPLIAIDLISGGNQQIWPINLFPCFLGIQISVAYSLSHKTLFTDFYQHSWHRKFWLTIAATLVTAGIIFCLIILQADTWWNKYGGEDTLSFTHIINRPKDPLIVVDRQRPESIIFYGLQPEVRLLFARENKLEVDSFKGNNDVFFLNPSLDLKAKLKLHQYDLNMLTQFPNPDRIYDHLNPPQLWKLKRLMTSID
jgi:hypothetical protein